MDNMNLTKLVENAIALYKGAKTDKEIVDSAEKMESVYMLCGSRRITGKKELKDLLKDGMAASEKAKGNLIKSIRNMKQEKQYEELKEYGKIIKHLEDAHETPRKETVFIYDYYGSKWWVQMNMNDGVLVEVSEI